MIMFLACCILGLFIGLPIIRAMRNLRAGYFSPAIAPARKRRGHHV